MPIKGITDRQPAFPRLGVLRKGAEKQGNRPGTDLKDRFRLTSDDPALITLFDTVYPDGNNIEVLLPYPRTSMNFDAWYRLYTASALHRVCDGETCQRWRDEQGVMRSESRPCLCNPDNRECKQSGLLTVIVPALGRMGYVSVITTSIYDIMQVQQNLEALEALMHGDLRNIPLILSRRFQMISTPEIDKQGNRTGKRARREKWLISLEPSPGWVQRQLAAMHQHALDTTTVLSLPDLERDYDVDDETGESIEPEMPAMSSNGNGDKLSHPNQENADRLKYLRNAMPILSLDTPDLPDSLRGVRIAEMPSDILDKATRDTRTHIAAHVKELQAQARRLDINASTDINEKTGLLTDKALIDLARRLAEMMARHEQKQQQNQATTYRLTPDDVTNDAHDVPVAAIEA